MPSPNFSPTKNDREYLKEVAAKIYGPRWKTELARRMTVNVITVKRWAKGYSPVPEEVWLQLMVDATAAMRAILEASKARGVDFSTDPKPPASP